MTCLWCHKPLAPDQKHYCSRSCEIAADKNDLEAKEPKATWDEAAELGEGGDD